MKTKIVLEQGSWGNWYANIVTTDKQDNVQTKPVNQANKELNLDREEVILAALAQLGIEVESHVHWYIDGQRTDKVISNL